MWTCPKCKEQIEDQFDSCWKCAGAPVEPSALSAKHAPVALIGVFLVALIFAALFAVGGAGIYGSPFGPGVHPRESAVYAEAILIGPLASLLAIVFHKRLVCLSGVLLVLGALGGIFIGLVVESDFRGFWGKVFAIFVWLPMSIVGARLLLRKPQP